MEALRFKRRIDDDTLVLTGLARFVGKEVEIVILVGPDDELTKPTSSAKVNRVPGSAKGLITLPEDFSNAFNSEDGM